MIARVEHFDVTLNLRKVPNTIKAHYFVFSR